MPAVARTTATSLERLLAYCNHEAEKQSFHDDGNLIGCSNVWSQGTVLLPPPQVQGAVEESTE